MGDVSLPPPLRRFGVFEVDPASGELRKRGRRIRVADQSFRLLLALMERPGEVVTRQQLRELLWRGDTFVDFDANLNTAMSLLREALGDSAKSPRFIETLPRRGYRFLSSAPDDRPEPPPVRPASHVNRRYVAALLSVAVLMLAGLSYRYMGVRADTIESLAVLPLVYAGPQHDGDQEYLADGLTSALITELARHGVPKVISETSAMRYKGVKRPLPSIARELGADLLVEGSVVREGNTVRVNAQLIDARTDRHIWARSYERELHSILALQDEIATAIVREIQSKLAPSVRVGATVSRTVNPQALEAYLRGRYALRNETEARLSQARQFFEEAIRIDPTYAPAYAGLADYYGYTDAVPPAEALPKAKRYALRALELDGTLAGAHLSLALATLWSDWDWAATEREFKRSLDLDPNDATTRRWYALFLDLMGRPRAALAQIQRVKELDPVSPRTYQSFGYHLFVTRQFDESLKQIRKIRELSPHDPTVFDGLGSAYVYMRAYDQAIAAIEEGIALWGRDPGFLAALAVAHAGAGHREKATALLDELRSVSRRRYVPPCWFAIIYMNLGEVDQAFEWLEKAFAARDAYLVHLKVSPLFDRVRGDARFGDLLRRMNFPPDET